MKFVAASSRWKLIATAWAFRTAHGQVEFLAQPNSWDLSTAVAFASNPGAVRTCAWIESEPGGT